MRNFAAMVITTTGFLALSCGDGPTGPGEPKALVYGTVYDNGWHNGDPAPFPIIASVGCKDDDTGRWSSEQYPGIWPVTGNGDGTYVIAVSDMPGYENHVGHTIIISAGTAEGHWSDDEMIYGFGNSGFPEHKNIHIYRH